MELDKPTTFKTEGVLGNCLAMFLLEHGTVRVKGGTSFLHGTSGHDLRNGVNMWYLILAE